jgi:hypothetical protein
MEKLSSIVRRLSSEADDGRRVSVEQDRESDLGRLPSVVCRPQKTMDDGSLSSKTGRAIRVVYRPSSVVRT